MDRQKAIAVSRTLADSGRSVVQIVAVAVLATIPVTLVALSWDVAGRPVRTVAELVGQANLLLAAFTALLTLALVISQIVYTKTATKMLLEARRTNDLHDADADERRNRQHAAEVRTVAAELIGTSATHVRYANDYLHLAGWRARWSIPQVTNRRFAAAEGMIAALGAAHVAAARATMTGHSDLSRAADEHVAAIEEHHKAALDRETSGRSLERIATSTKRLERLGSKELPRAEVPIGD